MAGCKKTTILRQSSYTCLYRNPLIEQKQRNSCSSDDSGSNGGVPLGAHMRRNKSAATNDEKENVAPINRNKPIVKQLSSENLLKPSSLHLCIKKHEPDSVIGFGAWDSVESEKSSSLSVWDYSDSEAAPASSWSTLPNRSLLYRPLPLDVGRCTCIIVKEPTPDGFDGGTFYTLYTHEGKGRQNRKLGVAYHRRRKGKSEFIVGQNARGIMAGSDDSLMGIVTSNVMGSKYMIWDQGHCSNSKAKQSKLLAAVKFMATVSTWTGNYRSIKAWIPKYQSMQLKNTNQAQHTNGLPTGWEGNKDRVHQLFSKSPSYSKITKQYELDFRDRGRTGLKIQSSVKNFQLTLERNGKQTILQLGRLGKSKYVMDYRYPLTGYQAFCMCLASIDSKLCCTV